MKKVMHSVLFPLLWRRLPGNREGGMALHGPPGNGKTVWLNLLRQFLVVIYKGGPDRYMDKYVGEAQERFRADAACSRMFGNRVSCIMIDEADSLLPDRNLSVRI
jgi:SpoVK/Ycf46/Vps4 family AAA+-type ATPase